MHAQPPELIFLKILFKFTYKFEFITKKINHIINACPPGIRHHTFSAEININRVITQPPADYKKRKA